MKLGAPDTNKSKRQEALQADPNKSLLLQASPRNKLQIINLHIDMIFFESKSNHQWLKTPIVSHNTI